MRIPEPLLGLIEDGLIDGVECPLKSGKEADLFVVVKDGYHYAAKVYKQRSLRSFKNDVGYTEGRGIRSSRAKRAVAKGTRFGRAVQEEGWRDAEADALSLLASVGASVPRVLDYHEGVLIMELICDPQGQLAPQLAELELSPEQAEEMCDALLGQVILMLCNDLVHGDFSPYNVLVRPAGPVVIDLPQVVSAPHNRQAARLLDRDVRSITRFLGLFNPKLRALGRQAWQIWEEYERGSLTPDFRPKPGRVRETRSFDLDDLTDYVREANEEGRLERAAANGDADAQTQLKAIYRRERRAAAAKSSPEPAKPASSVGAAEKGAPKKPARPRSAGTERRGAAAASSQPTGSDKKSSRRRRRKSRPAGASTTPAGGATPQTNGSTGSAKPRRRRRRRRRRGPQQPGSAEPTRGGSSDAQLHCPTFRR